MALGIVQDSRYQGDDWWDWSVWLDGPDEELDAVDHVVYTLHRTFPDPVRTVRDRSTRFRLAARGWGTFRIYAKVVSRGGAALKLHHDLDLRYPSGEATLA
jgi:transcription initiation factor IIF auxiliary subunit